MLEFLSLGSHSSKPCSAKKQKVQVELLQARVALAWGRPQKLIRIYPLPNLGVTQSLGSAFV